MLCVFVCVCLCGCECVASSSGRRGQPTDSMVRTWACVNDFCVVIWGMGRIPSERSNTRWVNSFDERAVLLQHVFLFCTTFFGFSFRSAKGVIARSRDFMNPAFLQTSQAAVGCLFPRWDRTRAGVTSQGPNTRMYAQKTSKHEWSGSFGGPNLQSYT